MALLITQVAPISKRDQDVLSVVNESYKMAAAIWLHLKLMEKGSLAVSSVPVWMIVM